MEEEKESEIFHVLMAYFVLFCLHQLDVIAGDIIRLNYFVTRRWIRVDDVRRRLLLMYAQIDGFIIKNKY